MATVTRALGRLPLRRRHAAAQADAPLENYVEFARRQWILIADGILAGVLAVAIYLITTPVGYQGDVTVMLSALPGVVGDGSAGSSEISVDSDAQVAASARVLKAAAARVHFPGGDSALADKLHLTARPNSRVLTIAVRANTAALARDTADAIAAELLRVRGQDFSSRLKNQRTALRRQIQVVTTELAAIAPASADEIMPPTPEVKATLLSKLSVLQLKAAELDGQAADPGLVTAPARAGPSGRSGLQAKLASGAMIGLLAGLAMAWLRDRGTRRRQRQLEDGRPPAEIGTR
jgi:polysaccharide biosynthesis transport protein